MVVVKWYILYFSFIKILMVGIWKLEDVSQVMISTIQVNDNPLPRKFMFSIRYYRNM